MKPVLLLLDDEDSVLRSLRRIFRRSEFQVLTANKGDQALLLLSQYEVGVIISDLRMPEMTGIEFLIKAKQVCPNAVRMVLSGQADLKTVTDSINSGNVYKFLTKPWEDEALLSAVNDGFERYRLSQYSNQLSRVFDSTLEGLVITNSRGEIESANAAFTSMFGYTEEDVLGKNIDLLSAKKTSDQFYQKCRQQLNQLGKWQGEEWVRCKNGEEVCQWLNVCLLNNRPNGVAKYIMVFVDLGAIKQRHEELRYQAFHDALTGLPNRRLFENHLDLAVKKAHRSSQPFALMFLDLNSFKQINDNHGHALGDEVLCLVSRRLSRAVRESDLLARVGGDEFCILLSVLNRETDAQYVAEKIKKIMSDPFETLNFQFNLSVSIGISTFPTDGVSAKLLLDNADSKMYSQKRQSLSVDSPKEILTLSGQGQEGWS